MSKVKEAVTVYWGDRCPDYDPECPTCQAWDEYDNDLHYKRRKQMKDQGLLDAVTEQMKIDIQSGDWTAIEELLSHTREDALVAFLSECGMPQGEGEIK